MNESEKISPEEIASESPQAGAVYRAEGNEVEESIESKTAVEHVFGDLDKVDLGPETVYPSNREKIAALSGEARKLLGGLWGKAKEATGLDRTFAKVEIAYDQFWADQSNARLQKIKANAEAIDKELETRKRLQKEYEDALPDLKKFRILGGAEHVASLVKEEKEKEAKLEIDKKEVGEKLTREESVKNAYEQRRNDIAEKFINRNAEKLNPIEADIAEHELRKKTLEEAIAGTREDRKKYEVHYREGQEFLKKWREKLKTSGKSEKEISEDLVIVEGEKNLAKERQALEEREEEQSRRLLQLNQRIAKAQAKAEPYRTKIKEFKAVTERGKKREEDNVADSSGSSVSSSRVNSSGSANYVSASSGVSGYSRESMFEDEYNQPVQAFVVEWNDFLRKEHGIKDGKDKIDLDKFTEATSWSRRAVVSEESFVKVLKSYYQQQFKGEAYPDKITESVKKFLEKRHQE